MVRAVAAAGHGRMRGNGCAIANSTNSLSWPGAAALMAPPVARNTPTQRAKAVEGAVKGAVECGSWAWDLLGLRLGGLVY